MSVTEATEATESTESTESSESSETSDRAAGEPSPARWDPDQYGRFADERARPFHDLLAGLELPGARRIVDLGCGTGSLTAELADRWPAATVEGVDNSPEMLEASSAYRVAGRVEFQLGDIASWSPSEPVDLLVSNAALQWVPGHLDLLTELASTVSPGGALAFQVPGNFGAPSHTILAELRSSQRWSSLLGDTAASDVPSSHEPDAYLARLAGAGLRPTVWETTYHQVLEGENAVLEWMKGTALRPILSVLSDADAQRFLAEYGELLGHAYQPADHGTVLPFRRIFAVAARPGALPEPSIVGLDHVQLAIPAGGEGAARSFYCGVLGLVERPKPPSLAARGGCWFEGTATRLHVGVDPGFRPADKAHPAIAVRGIDELATLLAANGSPVRWDTELAPLRRFYTADPFGNRLEVMEA